MYQNLEKFRQERKLIYKSQRRHELKPQTRYMLYTREMDMTLVKPEEKSRCHSLNMEEGEMQEVKCVKRRRRSPAITPVPSGSQALQADHATSETTTTTKVKRSSRFRGVSRHRWTGRYEAHLWDKGTWNATQRKKGKQVYLGAYGEEESAARAYDLAAIKYWGTSTSTNFPISDYAQEIEIMQHLTREEYLASLRRKSNGFARGASKYRGVARHHHNGRWEARIGRVFGNKYLYLGTYSTQEEAARAYDIAAIEYRGINAMTNFEMSSYIRWLKPGLTNSSAATEGLSTKSDHHQAIQTVTNEGCFISHKQDIIETKLPLSSSPRCKPSSPTALSLLLRSSMFKELKEKNQKAENEETKGIYVSNNNSSINWLGNGFTFVSDEDNVAYVSNYIDENLRKLESPRDLLPLLCCTTKLCHHCNIF